MSIKKVLIGCEFSGQVRRAFRDRGLDAWSCDLLPADDGDPHHIQADVLGVLADGWDLAVFHPPCTHLAVSGARYFARKQKEQTEALAFVQQLLNAPIPHIALENPVSIISSRIRKPDQIIQPWMFGDAESKKTCLWLKNLPLLKPTAIIGPQYIRCPCGIKYPASGTHCPQCGTPGTDTRNRKLYRNQTPSGQNNLGPSKDRWKLRSKTYFGIAQAMGTQWGDYICEP